jgi:hypothetical protein
VSPAIPGGGHDTAGDRKLVQLRLAVEFSPGHATLSPNRTSDGIDVNTLHRRQVDHKPAIDGRASRHIVAAAANRDFKVQVLRKLDGADNVGHAAGASNQYRVFVHQPVVNLPGIVKAHIGGLKQLARERAGKFFLSDCNRQS